MAIRIILADDHEITREGLRSLLEKENDLCVIAEAGDGRATLDLVDQLKPDVVVMDITMPKLNGIDATRAIALSHPSIKVVALSVHSDRLFVSEMLSAGASAYLLKESSFKELTRAIRLVMKGGTYLCPRVIDTVVKDYADQVLKKDSLALPTLTNREREILQLLAEGNSAKEIAHSLNLSVKTVHTHRQRIMEKLEIDNVAGLVKFAIRHGMTTLDIP